MDVNCENTMHLALASRRRMPSISSCSASSLVLLWNRRRSMRDRIDVFFGRFGAGFGAAASSAPASRLTVSGLSHTGHGVAALTA